MPAKCASPGLEFGEEDPIEGADDPFEPAEIEGLEGVVDGPDGPDGNNGGGARAKPATAKGYGDDFFSFVRQNGYYSDPTAPVLDENYELEAKEFMTDPGDFGPDKSAQMALKQLSTARLNQRAVEGSILAQNPMRANKFYGSELAAGENNTWWVEDDS